MKRPSKSEIKAAVTKLNEKPEFSTGKSEGKRAHFSTQDAEKKTKNGK